MAYWVAIKTLQHPSKQGNIQCELIRMHNEQVMFCMWSGRCVCYLVAHSAQLCICVWGSHTIKLALVLGGSILSSWKLIVILGSHFTRELISFSSSQRMHFDRKAWKHSAESLLGAQAECVYLRREVAPLVHSRIIYRRAGEAGVVFSLIFVYFFFSNSLIVSFFQVDNDDILVTGTLSQLKRVHPK